MLKIDMTILKVAIGKIHRKSLHISGTVSLWDGLLSNYNQDIEEF